MTSPAILHIDTGRTFRGGQRQLLLLAEKLRRDNIKQVIACPGGSELVGRIEDIPTIKISSQSLKQKLTFGPLRDAVIEHGLNIIHAHDSSAHTMGIQLKKNKSDLRLIVSRRVIFPPSGWISRRFKYRRHVDHYIAISKAVASGLEEIGVEGGRISIINSALDIGKIKSLPPDNSVKARIAGCKFLVVTAGALTSEKDFVTAILAIKKASAKIDGLGLIILGDGPQREQLEKIVVEEKLENILLLGHREPMSPIFKACDLFMMTSLSEGLNSSAIEAAACGLPLVVSGVGGLPEIAEKGYNGLHCVPGNPEQFAMAIVDLYEDEKTRKMMAENSARKSEQFDLGSSAQKTVELYNTVLAAQA